MKNMPILLAERSNASVCCRSLAGICKFESRQGHGCLSLLSVVSRRGLCGGPISRRADLELWCVVVCDLETSRMPALGSSSRKIVGVVMLVPYSILARNTCIYLLLILYAKTFGKQVISGYWITPREQTKRRNSCHTSRPCHIVTV